MSTIADYSVFTKKFLASGMTDFSQLYGNKFKGENSEGTFRAFAVIPFNLDAPLTPREAMNFDLSKLGLTSASMPQRVSCRDANGEFIGNIVRVQPSQRNGSIRFVAKVAVPDFVSSDDGSNPADAPFNTFVLVRTDASTNIDLPIAVATISEGYNLHKHKVVHKVADQFDVQFADPLDDVENANYVSFTINHLNGYTSVDFNPDAYATYDDVANALSRGIDGLHIAFDTASGDLKLLDKDGNVLDQANLPIKADVIIAEGEEGYKYVKTDVKQDIHAAKAWMPKDFTAWETVPEAPYTMQHAALVVDKGAQGGSGRSFVPSSSKDNKSYPISVVTYTIGDLQGGKYTLTRSSGTIGPETITGVSWKEGGQPLPFKMKDFPVTDNKVEFLVITRGGKPYLVYESENGVCSASDLENTSEWEPSVAGTIVESGTSGGSSADRVLGIAIKGDGDVKTMYTFDEGAETHSEITSISGKKVRWLDTKVIPGGTSLKYGLEAFVWTVKDREVKIIDPFFQQLNDSLLALGFHEGDDIALGTNLSILAPTEGVSPLNKVDAGKYIHGKDNKATREQEVDAQRANAKEELVAWNAQHPTLTENRQDGTIIDHTGLDVRAGHITLGCGRIGEEGVFQKVNYGIQMKERRGVGEGDKTSESLDFTVSHHTGLVQFDANGHAAQTDGNGGFEPLTSSTLLSIEAGSYISGAPTCLILAKVTRKPKGEGSPDPLEGSPVLTPVRMTAGFSVAQNYDTSNGLNLTLHDDRENISAVLVGPNNNPIESSPAIIEVQAIYTHRNAENETVPAQQMHTYIGEWVHGNPRSCSFLCNKIEEWMTAIDLTNPDPNSFEDVELYVVIRVY